MRLSRRARYIFTDGGYLLRMFVAFMRPPGSAPAW